MNRDLCLLVYLYCTRSRWVAYGIVDLFKVSIVSELNPPLLSIVHWSYRIHNKHTIFCVSGAFTEEENVALPSALSFPIFLATFHVTLLAQSSCSEVSYFPRVFLLKTGRVRISLMKFTFWDNASRLLFSFPNFSFVPGAFWEFHGVSRRSVQSQFSSFP